MTQRTFDPVDHADMAAEWIADHGGCERCAEFDEVHDSHCPHHPDYDPTPWCSGCGAMKRKDCDCGPIAENN